MAQVDPVFKERLANWLQGESLNANGSFPSAPSVPSMTAVHPTPITPLVDTESHPSTVAASLVVPPTPLNTFADDRFSTRVSPPSTRTAPVTSESDPLVAPNEIDSSISSLSEHDLTSLDGFACDEIDLSLFSFVDKYRAAAPQVCIDRLLRAFRMSNYHHDARESLWRRQESLRDSIFYTRDKLHKLLEDSREVAQTALTRSETENDRLRSENARLFNPTRIVAENSREQAIGVSFLESVVEEEHLGREADANVGARVQEGDGSGQVNEDATARNDENERSAKHLTSENAETGIQSGVKSFDVYADPGLSNQASQADLDIENAKPIVKSVKFVTPDISDHNVQPNDGANDTETEPDKVVSTFKKAKQSAKGKAGKSDSKSKNGVENEKPVLDGLRRSGRTKRAGA